MSLDLTDAITQLRTTGDAITALCVDVGDEQARWRPGESDWPMLFVMCHLYDEERFDFRRRLELTLRDSAEEWPHNDIDGWISAHDYAGQTLPARLRDWQSERTVSLGWLEGLHDAAWGNAHATHFGPLRARDLLASWVAHDLLHLRQLNELRYAWLKRRAAPDHIGYAGDW